jgi:hypothetical protein
VKITANRQLSSSFFSRISALYNYSCTEVYFMSARRQDQNRIAPFTVAIFLLIVAAIVVSIRSVPPHPKSAGSPVDQFSAVRASQFLQRILGDGSPHPVGSVANAAVRSRIVAELRGLGYQPEIQYGFECSADAVCADVANVVAERHGYDRSEVLLAAHYDSVAAGPGASDDLSGVAAILETARLLKAQSVTPFRHSIILLFTDGEEAGSLGARLFVEKNPHAQRVFSAVNLEARGTSGPSVMFETGPANYTDIQLFSQAVRRPDTNSLYYTI